MQVAVLEQMKRIQYKFNHGSTDVYLDASFAHLGKLVDKKNTVIITDEHIFKSHPTKFNGWNSIVLKPGEEYKVQATVDAIVEQLIKMETDRSTILVGVGGGVVVGSWVEGGSGLTVEGGDEVGLPPTFLAGPNVILKLAPLSTKVLVGSSYG